MWATGLISQQNCVTTVLRWPVTCDLIWLRADAVSKLIRHPGPLPPSNHARRNSYPS